MSEVKSESAKKQEDWMNSKWRPMMGWMYMVVCTADFVVFPVLWSLVQALHGGQVNSQWNPITLQGAGLFHMAMGAILGIAAYGRTQEKLGDKAGATMPIASTTQTTQTTTVSSTSINNQRTPVFAAVSAEPAAPAPVVGYGGKLAPPPAEQPLI